MFARIREDIRTVFLKDPAARNIIEVVLCYPGVHANFWHRAANWLYLRRAYTLARIISHCARQVTGIEIHPGAKIGRRFFIDHGMGVVIGETAEVGDDCLMYQGAVLGGTTLAKGKRHPALGKNVVVGAGAIVLGPVTVGDNARIGAGSVVLTDVPPGSTVIGVPGRIGLGFTRDEIEQLEHSKLPDPIADGFKLLLREIEQLEKRVCELESLEGIPPKKECEELLEKKKEIEQEFK